jgi:hypothetical protein
MLTALVWWIVGVGGAVVCARFCRQRWGSRATLPNLATVDGTRARLGAGRDIAQHWAQMTLAAAIGVFCVLTALGALLQLATDVVTRGA